MSARAVRNLSALKTFKKLSNESRKKFLKRCNPDFVNCLSEVCHNLLRGNIKVTPAQLKKLTRYKKTLRTLASKRTSLKKRKRLLNQKGGFLGALIAPALSAITGLIGGLINR